MIRIECEQGSAEWAKARSGIPTASNFHRIVTPKTGRLSESSHAYLCELLAERMLGVSLDDSMSEWMERGKELEESAVAYYELQKDTETEEVGFCLRDDRSAGCSPDRLVGDDGGLEIKCPSAAVHVAYLIDPPHKYRPQIQGSLWVTGREWWDFLSYNPILPPALIRFERDEDYIEKLAAAVGAFSERLEEAFEKMKARGYVELSAPPAERREGAPGSRGCQ